MNTKFVTTLILIALSTTFIIQNAGVVDIRFLFWKISLSGAIMFVFLILIGILVGWLLHGHMLHKKNNTKQNSE